MRVAFACGVFAPAIDVRRLFHRLTLSAAILPCGCLARTNWVCALIGFLGVHLFSPGFGPRTDDLSLDTNRKQRASLYRKEHNAILVGLLQLWIVIR